MMGRLEELGHGIVEIASGREALGRIDDEVDAVGQRGGGAGSRPDVGTEHLEDAAPIGGVGLVDHDDGSAQFEQGVGVEVQEVDVHRPGRPHPR